MNRDYGMLTDEELLFLAAQEQIRNQQRQNQQFIEENIRNQQMQEQMRVMFENINLNRF